MFDESSCGVCGAGFPVLRPAEPSSLESHVRDYSDPHHTLARVPGTTLMPADPVSAEGVLPGQRWVNTLTNAEFLCADAGSGLEWVRISAGGWTPEELESRLAEKLDAESAAGTFATKEELAALDVPETDSFATDSEAYGYAQDALRSAKAYADGLRDGLELAIASLRAEMLTESGADSRGYATVAMLASLATSADLAALRARAYGMYGESESELPGGPRRLPDLASAQRARVDAVLAEIARLRARLVWDDESESAAPVLRSRHHLSTILASERQATSAAIAAKASPADVASAIASALASSGFIAESDAEAVVSRVLAASVVARVEPSESESDYWRPVASGAVATHVAAAVGDVERTTRFNLTADVARIASASLAAAAGAVGGRLAEPVAAVDGTDVELSVDTATTTWYDVPATARTIEIDVGYGEESSGEESSGEPVRIAARDAVVALKFPSGWSYQSGDSVSVVGDATYATGSNTGSLSDVSAGDLVVVAVHEIARDVFMFTKRVMALASGGS